MIKKDIVNSIVEEKGYKRAVVKDVIESTMQKIEEALVNNEKVTLANFGTFEPRERKTKVGTDPSTGKRIEIEAKVIPYFKPSKNFKEAVVEANKKK